MFVFPGVIDEVQSVSPLVEPSYHVLPSQLLELNGTQDFQISLKMRKREKTNLKEPHLHDLLGLEMLVFCVGGGYLVHEWLIFLWFLCR